jgi:hypothetical protein
MEYKTTLILLIIHLPITVLYQTTVQALLTVPVQIIVLVLQIQLLLLIAQVLIPPALIQLILIPLALMQLVLIPPALIQLVLILPVAAVYSNLAIAAVAVLMSVDGNSR